MPCRSTCCIFVDSNYSWASAKSATCKSLLAFGARGVLHGNVACPFCERSWLSKRYRTLHADQKHLLLNDASNPAHIAAYSNCHCDIGVWNGMAMHATATRARPRCFAYVGAAASAANPFRCELNRSVGITAIELTGFPQPDKPARALLAGATSTACKHACIMQSCLIWLRAPRSPVMGCT